MRVSDFEGMAGTALSAETYRAVMRSQDDALQANRLVTGKALQSLDDELDLYDTVESLMREATDPAARAAAVAVARIVAGEEAGAHDVKGDLVLEEEDRVVMGDLTVAGNLINGGALTVTGNLTVRGNYLERAHGYALLAVGGDLVVDNLASEYEVIVLGDLRAEGLVYGFEKDHPMNVGGTLTAQALVQDNHKVNYKLLEVGAHFPRGLDKTSAARIVVAKALANDELDREALCSRLASGKPVLKESKKERFSLTPRLSALIELMRNAATYEITEMTGKPAVRIVNADGSRQISFVSVEEQDIIRAALGV